MSEVHNKSMTVLYMYAARARNNMAKRKLNARQMLAQVNLTLCNQSLTLCNQALPTFILSWVLVVNAHVIEQEHSLFK